MSQTFESPPVLTGKRKRTAVSYVEADEFIDDVLSDVEEAIDNDSAVDTDDDDTFGSRRKKALNKKASPKKKSKTTIKLKKSSFRLLDLPPELRDMIYEMSLTDANDIALVPNTKGFRRTVSRGKVYSDESYRISPWRRRRFAKVGAQEVSPITTHFIPALLAVNRQINAEAMNFLYNQHFIFQDTKTLHSFLATIGHRNQQRLQHLSIMDWGNSGVSKANNHCALALLAGATNLKSLAFCCDVKYYSAKPRWIARRIYNDGHHFLEAYGSANGRKDAAVDILHIGEETLTDYYEGNQEPHDKLEEAIKAELRTLLGDVVSKKKKRASE